MEHLQHFGLTRDPFSNEPDLRFYFDSGSHHDAQRRVERGLRQHKGLTVLTGDGGMGKTLLARRILDALEEEVFESTLLMMLPGAADSTSILQRFARQIGCDEPATDRAELLGQIYELLSIVREDGRHAVLIIDDAQIMAPAALAELGGLLSLEYEHKRLLSMLLVGSPELDQLVEDDAGMKPRVDVRVRLQPFDLVNAKAYVQHRLALASSQEGLVSAEAVETLHKFGRGRPRLINTLADNALFETYLGGRLAIEPMDVERAAGDLGIGPDPGTTFSPQHRAVPPPPTLIMPPPPARTADEPEAASPLVSAPSAEAATSPPTAEAVAPAAAGPGMKIVPQAEPATAAPVDSLVMPTPAFSLDEPAPAASAAIAEPEAELELTSEVPIVEEAPISPTLDLDEGLEAALSDFDVPEEAGAPSLSLVPPPPETVVSEFEFDSTPELELDAPATPTEADRRDSAESGARERVLPPVAEIHKPLEFQREPEAPEAEPKLASLLPPAIDLMAEAEAVEAGIAEPEGAVAEEEFSFGLEPVTTPSEARIRVGDADVLEMDLEAPVEAEDLALETDFGVIEAAELTPLEVDSAEEFDDGLFVELLEE